MSRRAAACVGAVLAVLLACWLPAAAAAELTAEERQIEDITRWLTSNGAVFNGSAIHDFGSTYGFGLIATRDVAADTALIDVPAALFLTCTPAVAQLIPQTFEGIEDCRAP
eukprot:tig00001065_g6732.t1